MNKQNETKYAIVQGMNHLAKRMSFKDIHVRDICTECKISRATFYRHFYNIDDAVLWLWDNVNKESLYQMGNIYGWKTAHIRQFSMMLDYKDLFIKAHLTAEFSFVSFYGRDCVLREVTNNIKNVHHYEMNETECFELEYYVHGCSYMFSKWVIGGMKQSPEYMADFFGRLIPPFLKELIGE